MAYKVYEESDAVKAAKANLDSTTAAQPAEYQSKYQTQIDTALSNIQNRPQFSYDAGSDPLYRSYRSQYLRNGRTAMMDTMGQAAALTGGYGNSYAQTVGQQQYQNYMSQLTDKIPELYSLALDAYQQQGDDMRQNYSLLRDADGTDYDRYRDAVSDWQANRSYYSDAYNSERSFDYSKYTDDRDYAYQQERDAIEDAQWQKEFDESVRQWNLQYAASKSSGSGSSGRSYSSGSSNSSSTTADQTTLDVANPNGALTKTGLTPLESRAVEALKAYMNAHPKVSLKTAAANLGVSSRVILGYQGLLSKK